MKVTALDGKVDAPSQRMSAQWWSYLVFTLCAGLYLLPFMRFMWLGSDEGMLLCGATKIAQGQVFARDFFEVIGPGTFYWLAAFFKLFGTSFLVARICLFVSSLGTALTVFFLSRQVCRRYQLLPCILLGAVQFGTAWPGVSHHLDSNFTSLLCVSCMVLWNSKRKLRWLIAAGVLAGVTTCIHQPKGVLLFGAVLLWLWMQSRKTPMPLLSAGVFAASFTLVIVIVLAYFWSQGALPSLVYANYTFPSQHYSSANKVAYAQGIKREYWDLWMMMVGRFKWAVPIGLVLIFPLVVVAAIVPLILLLAFRYDRGSMTPTVLLFFLSSCAIWISELHRLDIYHLVFASPLWIILFVHMLGDKDTRIRHLASRTLATDAAFLMAFNFFVVAGLAHPIATRVGTVHVLGNDPAFNFLNETLPRGAEIWVYPYSPSYYFLTGSTNPTRLSILVYSLHTRSQFDEVLKVLESRKVKYVVWDTKFISRVSGEIYPGAQPPASDYLIEPYLQSHYKPVRDFNGVQILERTEGN